MAKHIRINLTNVAALKEGEEAWDTSLSGFWVRKGKGAKASYGLVYRFNRVQRRHTFRGRFTPDQARDEAKKALGKLAQGIDPQAVKVADRLAPTVADICASYIRDAEDGTLLLRGGPRQGRPLKPASLYTKRSIIRTHIVPLLGDLRADEMTKADFRKFLADVTNGVTAKHTRPDHFIGGLPKGGAQAARHAGMTLGAIFTHSLIMERVTRNPCSYVPLPAKNETKRRILPDEYDLIGLALCTAVDRTAGEHWAISPRTVDAFLLAILTGLRSTEAARLRWREIDFEHRTVTLDDDDETGRTIKNGRTVRPLSHDACAVLRRLWDTREPTADAKDDRVFHTTRRQSMRPGDSDFFHLDNSWERFRKFAGLDDLQVKHGRKKITPHIFRHSYSSVAGDLGASDLIRQGMLGHRAQGVTNRVYTHVADEVSLDWADRTGRRTMRLLGLIADDEETAQRAA